MKPVLSKFFLLSLIIISLIYQIINPNIMYAVFDGGGGGSGSSSDPTKTTSELRDIGVIYSKLQAFRQCADEFLTVDGIDIGDGPFNLSFAPKLGDVANPDKAIGYLVDGDDGRWDCASDEGTREDAWFKVLGYTSWDGGEGTSYVNGSGHIFENHGNYYFSPDGSDPGTPDVSKAFFLSEIDGKINETIASLSEKEKKALKYQILAEAFFSQNGCNATESGGLITNSDKDKVTIGGIEYIVNNDGKGVFDGEVAVGHGDFAWGGRGTTNCNSLASELTNLYDSWSSVTGETDQSAGTEPNNGDDTTKPNCESSITNVGWIICPVIDGAFAIMRVVEGAVVGQLKFTLDDIGGDPTTDANTTQKIKQSHGSILLISNYLFAIGILWIVISQAITGGAGGGFFGAYEAKKILPKLIAGIFVANVSWELVNLLLIITNAIGDSIKSIMLAPFEGATNLAINFNNGSDLLLVGVGAGLGIGLAIFGFFAVSPLLIMVLIAVLSAIIFSVLRKGMIIVLVIFAPIMLALSPFMPNIFKRYYKLLLNVILFYIVVMVSIAAFTIIGYIIFQGAGGGNSSATSIGQSLTKLIGIAFYFGWMFPVLAFAKNNFDVVGKVGGSLQSMGNKAGRQFGQNRLQGNERRQGRELRKNWRNQRTKEKALESDMNKLTYKGNNPFKKGRSKFMQGQQVGFIPTRGVKKWQSERDRMMGIAENQVLEESVKKATEEASYKGMSSIPYLPKNNVSITDSEGNVLKDDKGKPLGVSTLGDVYKHLAAGRKISYKGRDGEERVLDGSQDGMRFMAAGALLKNGDATQAIDLNKIIDAGTNPDKGTMTQEAKDARSSLDYMMKDGGAAFASTVPHLMNIPAATYMTAGSSKLMGYKPVTISQGASEVIAGNDSTARDQMFNSFKELNTIENLFGERKQDHMNTFAQEIDKSFSKGGATVKYAGKEYKSAEELKTALGYDRWSGKSDQPTDTPDPGTYRDDDGNTRQSGGPGSGGVILG